MNLTVGITDLEESKDQTQSPGLGHCVHAVSQMDANASEEFAASVFAITLTECA
jgi:hypothetical protein